jgi:histidyl-tRNA synthetase
MNKGAAKLARELRHHALVIELGDETFRLKKSLETASKLGARFAIIVGENEASSGNFALKDLGKGEQITVSRGELASRIQSAPLTL